MKIIEKFGNPAHHFSFYQLPFGKIEGIGGSRIQNMGKSPLNTLHLIALDENNMPVGGIGSACLLRLAEGLVLLGVRHVMNTPKRWAVHIGYLQSRGSANFVLPAPTFFKRFDLSSQAETDLDFFVLPVELSQMPRHQKWEGRDVLSVDKPKRIFKLTDLAEPNEQDTFEFSGLVKPQLVEAPFPHAFYDNTLVEFQKLSLVKIERDRLMFKLPTTHPGHEWFRGTSGAPITNQNGKLVALVMGGCDETNTIVGFPLVSHLSLIQTTLAVESDRKSNEL